MGDLVKEVLNKVGQLLEQIQSQQEKIDNVMERLDKLQHILESQKKKQDSLDVKLSEMATIIEGQKAFTRDQLKEVQNEILARLRDIKADASGAAPVIQSGVSEKTGRQVKNETDIVKTVLVEIRSIPDVVRGHAKEELTQLEKLLESRLADVETAVNQTFELINESVNEQANQSGRLIKTMEKQPKQIVDKLEKHHADIIDSFDKHYKQIKHAIDKQFSNIIDILNKLTSPNQPTSTHRAENIETLSKQQGDIANTIGKQHTNIIDTLHKHEEQILGALDKQITDMSTKQTQSVKDIEKIIESVLNSIATMKSQIDKSVEKMITSSNAFIKDVGENLKITRSEVKHDIQEIRNMVRDSSTTLGDSDSRDLHGSVDTYKNKDDLRKQVAKADASRADNWTQFKVEIEKVKTAVHSLTEILDKGDKKMSQIVTKLESFRDNLGGDKDEQSSGDIAEYLDKVKHEIFAVTEKEAQILRDLIEGRSQKQETYTFDFYVENFQSLVGSDRDVESAPWYVSELRSCMKGCVAFYDNDEMRVWLLYGRHPNEVGLAPSSRLKLKIKATICDIHKKTLPDLVVGDMTWVADEATINCNYSLGVKLGMVSCDELINNGYGEKEGYGFGSVLIRFNVGKVA